MTAIQSVKTALANDLAYLPRGSYVTHCTDGYWAILGHLGSFFLGADGTARPAGLPMAA
jgi:hypothetical protein